MSNFKLVFSWVLTAILLAMPVAVFAWGSKGHQTVGAIAGKLLAGSRAEIELARILDDDESLMSISVWADCVKHPQLPYCTAEAAEHQDEWQAFLTKVGKDAASSYHFADVDIHDAKGYVFNPQQQDEDVVHGMVEAIGVLSADSAVANPHHLDRREALWLLTHLLGDVHQPLHVGVLAINGDVKATLGSNWLYPNASSCLHAKWDDAYVVAAMKASGADSVEDYADYLVAKQQNQLVADSAGAVLSWPVSWANESISVAREVALNHLEPGEKMLGTCGFQQKNNGWAIRLPAGYPQQAAVTAEAQLWKAGVRLAATLKAIWP